MFLCIVCCCAFVVDCLCVLFLTLCVIYFVCVFFLCVPFSFCVCLYMRVICCVRVSSPLLLLCLLECVMLLIVDTRFKPDAFVYVYMLLCALMCFDVLFVVAVCC